MNMAVLIILTCAFGLIVYFQQRMIVQLQREKSELMDRWYISKGLPVRGIDVKKVQEEKQEQMEERKRNALPRADQLTKGRFALIQEEQQKLGQTG